MTHARPRIAAALALAASLLLGACNNASTPSAQAPIGHSTANRSHAPATAPANAASTIAATAAADSGSATDACSLITQQEAGTAVGGDPGAGKPFSSHGVSQCQYGSYQSGFVLVNLTPTRGRAAYDLMRNRSKPGGEVHVADVAGVGDRAFGVTGPNTASIYFDKGDALVLVMVAINKASAPPKGQVLILAKTAAGRA